jgi:poly-gamma-glutamate system protein
MKKVYHRSEKISYISLILLASFSALVVFVVSTITNRTESYESWWKNPEGLSDVQRRMIDASEQTALAFDTIHCTRVDRGHRMLDIHDPADSGMLGPSMSLVTTLPGHLDAKLTSVNPNFAAVVARLLLDAGAKPGDKVAIGVTGSFPALNIAVYCAAESLELEPIIVSSAAASQFGANEPDLMWPDMEKLLFDEGIFRTRSKQISLGGFFDRAGDMSDDTRNLLVQSVKRSGIDIMDSQNDQDAISRRMNLYGSAANGELDSYVAYINVGGGEASVAGTIGNDAIGEGLIWPRELRSIRLRVNDDAKVDCCATRFLDQGVPVINMINVVRMAKKFGMPVASQTINPVGQGNMYSNGVSVRLLALLGIAAILAATWATARPPVTWLPKSWVKYLPAGMREMKTEEMV